MSFLGACFVNATVFLFQATTMISYSDFYFFSWANKSLLWNFWLTHGRCCLGEFSLVEKRSSAQEIHNPLADTDMYPWALDSRPWNNYSNRGSRNVPWEGKEMSNDIRPRDSRIEFKTHCLCIGGIWAHTGKGVSFQLGNEWSLKEGLMSKGQLSNIPTGYTMPFTQP